MSASKTQWIEATGGFRIDESEDEFLMRVEAIQKIERRIKAGKAKVEDIEQMVKLKGIEEE